MSAITETDTRARRVATRARIGAVCAVLVVTVATLPVGLRQLELAPNGKAMFGVGSSKPAIASETASSWTPSSK